MSTSRSYLRKRLIAVGRADLVEAVESGQGILMYHAAEEAGLIRRRPILGSGSPNQTKARLWAMAKITRRAPVPLEPAQPRFSPPPKRDVLDVQTQVKHRRTKSAKEPELPKLKLDPRALIG